MSIAQQIESALRALPAHRVTVASALQALTESIPGVAFPEVVVIRDGSGAIGTLIVTFMDEIHDPSLRRISVEMGG